MICGKRPSRCRWVAAPATALQDFDLEPHGALKITRGAGHLHPVVDARPIHSLHGRRSVAPLRR